MSTRLRLIHRGRVPYGALYELQSPETGMVGRGSTFEQLEASVRKYRMANAIPIGLGFLDELELAVCAKYRVECEEYDPLLPPKKKRLDYNSVVVGTQVMLSMAAHGFPVVEDAEAERRAAICAGTCKSKYNIDFAMPCGGFCGVLAKAVNKAVGDRKTSHHDELKSCGVCGCVLSAAVWVPLELQWAPLKDEQKAHFHQIPWCWKKGDKP